MFDLYFVFNFVYFYQFRHNLLMHVNQLVNGSGVLTIPKKDFLPSGTCFHSFIFNVQGMSWGMVWQWGQACMSLHVVGFLGCFFFLVVSFSLSLSPEQSYTFNLHLHDPVKDYLFGACWLLITADFTVHRSRNKCFLGTVVYSRHLVSI